MGKGRMCCLWLALCYLSQSGYLLDKGGNDGFCEFLFKVIVANGCSQKPLSLCRDLYSRSTEQSLSFFCCHFLCYQPRFAGLTMVCFCSIGPTNFLLLSTYLHLLHHLRTRLAWFLLVVTHVLVALCPQHTYSLPGVSLRVSFIRGQDLSTDRDLMFPHRYSGV